LGNYRVLFVVRVSAAAVSMIVCLFMDGRSPTGRLMTAKVRVCRYDISGTAFLNTHRVGH